jgi:DNA-binding LytR/AlgR family response regulator
LTPDLLAIVVAVVAFGLSGIFLLTLVPERPLRAKPATQARPEQSLAAVALLPSAGQATPAAAVSPNAIEGSGTEPALALEAEYRPARLLPVLRDGANHFIAVKDIVAVHANAHYTYVFDGAAKVFCPLSIGEVQARLNPAQFIRVHRSHIVNIEHVIGLKRAGDHGLIELAAHDPYTVPVSRSRFGELKSQLGLGAREAAQ